MAKKTRIKAPAKYAIPQTRAEASEAIRKMGIAQRELSRIEADMNDQLAIVREKFEAAAQPLREDVEALQNAVQTFCEANRAELTNDGKVKTAIFAAGEVQWRMRPASVSVRNVDGVIETLKRRLLGRFLRTKEEINKEAILAEPEAVKNVPGIKIQKSEDFVVMPFETDLASI